ncbi:MAG: hypothetical protein P4L84_31850 [Isosphaeraceae bacterium]|nr:hypothetical protein [Isosphaeraceae bacterium]
MTLEENTPALDLIRWTFTVNPEHRAAIEGHLSDLGLVVNVHDDTRFVVSWEEPDESADEVIEAIWALNGEPFEVTQEEFQRLSLNILQHTDEDVQEAA